MGKHSRVRGLFYWADTEGIPLDLAYLRLKPDPDVWFILLCEYVADAVKAGWKKDKIISELRELVNFSIPTLTFLWEERRDSAPT
jgi:hypothetical protein